MPGGKSACAWRLSYQTETSVKGRAHVPGLVASIVLTLILFGVKASLAPQVEYLWAPSPVQPMWRHRLWTWLGAAFRHS